MSAADIEIIEESISIPWGEQSLRGVLAYPAAGNPRQGVIIAGPHPLLGGALKNNVTAAAARAAARTGWLALRFAYREPDRAGLIDQMDRFWATGHLEEDAGRLGDLCAAVTVLSRLAPIRCLVGYSFGCWLTAQLVDQLPFQLPVAMIAPTLHQHDFAAMRRHTAEKLVIASDGDFTVTLPQLTAEIQNWPGILRCETLASTDHFFRGREAELERVLAAWLAERPCTPAPADAAFGPAWPNP